MARSLNKTMIIGNLGADPEVRTTPGGTRVATLSVATSRSWTGKTGDQQERTEWHRIVVWGKSAENCAQFLQKGRSVYIEGKLQTQEWEDKDGNKRKTTEIVAQTVQFLGGRGGAEPAGGPAGDSGSLGAGSGGGGSSAPPSSDVPF